MTIVVDYGKIKTYPLWFDFNVLRERKTIKPEERSGVDIYRKTVIGEHIALLAVFYLNGKKLK